MLNFNPEDSVKDVFSLFCGRRGVGKQVTGKVIKMELS